MNDDWRLRLRVHEEGLARALSERLEASELEHDLESAFHERVIVTVDGPELFCYAGSREQAERARELIRRLAQEHGIELAELELQRWHPAAERWEDPDVPLPADGEQAAAEHEELLEEERAEAELGHPPFEVRVALRSHGDTRALSQALEREGIAHMRRWRHLLVPAPDEEMAGELAERVRALAPAGAEVEVAPTLPAGAIPPNPFSIFGGLGG
jgi:hypothetical protein